ncbi:MAG: Arc family DNA binding domain-containing protein [Acidobacteriota bacterium]
MPRKAFLLRLSPELWEEVNRWASDELRSVNGQIEYILRRAVEERRRRRSAPLEEGPGGEERLAPPHREG